MAKIGTAHIEIKPVINEEALAQIIRRIEDSVADGVRRGADRAMRDQAVRYGPSIAWSADRPPTMHRH